MANLAQPGRTGRNRPHEVGQQASRCHRGPGGLARDLGCQRSRSAFLFAVT